jgi:DNA processing protein
MAQLADAEVQALLALRLIEGLGPVRIEALLNHFGAASRVLRAGAGQLAQVHGIGAELSAQIVASLRELDVAAEVQRIAAGGVGLYVKGEADYPAGLTNIATAPPLLFVRGQVLASDERAVALVGRGTRRRRAER